MKERARILIADDHNLFTELCRRFLETEFEVVGAVNDGYALIRAAGELKPDVILLDVAISLLNGLEAAQKLREVQPLVKLVYLTANSNHAVAAEAFRRGASGYLLKTCAPEEMALAVRQVVSGKKYLSRSLSPDAIDCFRWQRKRLVNEEERLTERQREVLQLLAEGKGMKEVGDILNVSMRTVAYHKYRMMDTLGARSNAELFKYALRNNMVAA